MAKSKEINAVVNERLSKSSPDVQERVITSLVEAELKRRATMVEKATVIGTSLEGEITALGRPDNIVVDMYGETIQSGFKPETIAKRKEVETKLAALDSALAKAMQSPCDYTELEKIIK